MVGYGFFQASTLGMRSQAHALNTIGTNVANVNTGGYKRTDTQFETVLSKTLDKNISDIGGVKAKDYQIIDSQGVVQSSDRDLDLAIIGRGFFQTSTSLTSTAPENLLYTRDGSFRISVENDITVPGAGFTSTTPVTVDSNGVQINPVTAKEGYLVDKNGYYVLGWSPEPDGTFSNSGAAAPMRIDPYTFTNTFTATTTGSFQANLPSNTEIITDHATAVLAADQGTNNSNLVTYTTQIVDSNGVTQTARINMTKSATNQWDVSATTSRATSPQNGTVLLSGTLEAGDQYSVTVDGFTETYTVLGTEASIADVRTALVGQLNANVGISPNVTAAAGNTNGEITLTANTAATTFTSSAAAANGANTAQVDTVTIGGTFEPGDIFTVTVDGVSVGYTAVDGDTNMAGVRTSLIAAINASPGMSALVTAAPGAAAGEITLTAVSTNSAIVSSVATTNAAPRAQVDTVTIGGTFELGDTYNITLNGAPFSYTAVIPDASMADVRTSLIAAFNLDGTVNGTATAAPGGGAFEITLTANTPGTALTTTSSATNVALGIADNTATTAITTTNVAGLADQTATVATTTAQVTTTDDNAVSSATTTSTQMSAITTITFSPQGTLLSTSPQTATLTMGFSDGGTSTLAMDVSGMTQFAGDFLPFSFDHNGLASANMERVQFDSAGHIVGSFSDGTQRKVYKVPLASFANPNALEMKNGMVFAETGESGTVSLFASDTSDIASFNPYSVELSNVDLASEFSRMIMVQSAYNSNATVFRTVDEMTTVARDLKA
jgi:flagellar hook protein FlgE